MFLKRSCFFFIMNETEQGWHSGESARIPSMCPGFDSRTRGHMWAEFVSSLREGFLRELRFSPLLKN